MLQKQGIRRRDGALVVILLITVFFIVLELVHPYYFLKNDNLDSYLCIYKKSYDAFKEFKIPLYSFNQFTGTRFFAMGQTGAFDPFVYVSLFLSHFFLGGYRASIEINVFMHLVLAGFFMYLLCDRFRFSITASMIAAISWPLSSFVIYYGRVWIIVILISTWIPLMLLGSMRLFGECSLKDLFFAAIPKILAFYCGHPQFFLYAVMFDFVFVLAYQLTGKTQISFQKFFLRYCVSMIPVVLICLPLLLPMYENMTITSSRSKPMTRDDFLAHQYDVRSFLIGVLFPFLQIDAYEVKNTFEEIAINTSHFGYVLLFAGIFGAVDFVKSIRLSMKSAWKTVNPVAIASFTAFLISFLLLTSRPVYSLLYLVPIVNRFRWPYKMTMNVVFFLILLCTCGLNRLLKKEMSVSKKKVTAIVLLAITIADSAVLYIILPSKYEGINVQGNIDERMDYYEYFQEDRYVTIGFPQFIYNEDLSQDPIYVSELNYNLATYYGFENYLGYNVFTQDDSILPNDTVGFIPITGSCCNPTPEFISFLRDLGVRLYIVSGYAMFGQRVDDSNKSEFGSEEVYDFVESLGMVKIYENGSFNIYEDPFAGFVVSHETESGAVERIDHSADINELHIMTEDSFDGGIIRVAYRYDRNFKCYIDGVLTEIVPDANGSSMLVDVPSGSHIINIKYKDALFNTSCVIAVTGIALFTLVYVVVKKFSSRKHSS